VENQICIFNDHDNEHNEEENHNEKEQHIDEKHNNDTENWDYMEMEVELKNR
jgi:hypothetical protein